MHRSGKTTNARDRSGISKSVECNCLLNAIMHYTLIIVFSIQESMVTVECVIAQRHHRTVMGAKGRKVQNITFEYDVQIKFPDRDVYG